MVVSVDFCGRQRTLTRKGRIDVPLVQKTRVRDVLAHVKNLFPELALSTKSILATVNHEVTDLDRVLRANDKVSFLPHIGGG